MAATLALGSVVIATDSIYDAGVPVINVARYPGSIQIRASRQYWQVGFPWRGVNGRRLEAMNIEGHSNSFLAYWDRVPTLNGLSTPIYEGFDGKRVWFRLERAGFLYGCNKAILVRWASKTTALETRTYPLCLR